MKKQLIHIGLLFLLLATVVSCRRKGVDLPDMRRNYSYKSKTPFGSYVAYQMFQSQFQSYYVYTPNKRFADYYNDIGGHNNLYFIIADEVLLMQDDVDAMLNYVSNGNRLFISSSYIDEKLLDTLRVKLTLSDEIISVFDSSNQIGSMTNTYLSLADTALHGSSLYGMFYYPFSERIIQYDSTISTVIGLNEQKRPDFISIVHGDGRIFIHLHPEAFSNYFLLQKKNKEYFEKAVSYMNSGRKSIYWDDYYRRGIYPQKKFSLFSVFLKYPPLKWALLTAVAGLMLFVLMGIKRRQRAIPIIVPNTNSSLSFVETIGRLYLQRKDHHNILHKMVTYFLEKIRTRYYLNTSHINAEFYASLSRKSGVPEEQVKSTFQYIQHLQEAASVSDTELLELHNRLLPYFKT